MAIIIITALCHVIWSSATVHAVQTQLYNADGASWVGAGL